MQQLQLVLLLPRICVEMSGAENVDMPAAYSTINNIKEPALDLFYRLKRVRGYGWQVTRPDSLEDVPDLDEAYPSNYRYSHVDGMARIPEHVSHPSTPGTPRITRDPEDEFAWFEDPFQREDSSSSLLYSDGSTDDALFLGSTSPEKLPSVLVMGNALFEQQAPPSSSSEQQAAAGNSKLLSAWSAQLVEPGSAGYALSGSPKQFSDCLMVLMTDNWAFEEAPAAPLTPTPSAQAMPAATRSAQLETELPQQEQEQASGSAALMVIGAEEVRASAPWQHETPAARCSTQAAQAAQAAGAGAGELSQQLVGVVAAAKARLGASSHDGSSSRAHSAARLPAAAEPEAEVQLLQQLHVERAARLEAERKLAAAEQQAAQLQQQLAEVQAQLAAVQQQRVVAEQRTEQLQVQQARKAPGVQVVTGQQHAVAAGQAKSQHAASQQRVTVPSLAGRSSATARQASARPQLQLQRGQRQPASAKAPVPAAASASSRAAAAAVPQPPVASSSSSSPVASAAGVAQLGVGAGRQSRLPSAPLAGTASVKHLVAGWVQRGSRLPSAPLAVPQVACRR